MENELQSKLVEILTSIQGASAKAADFTMEQLPEIAQAYVAYGQAVHTTWAVVGLLVFVIAWAVMFIKAFVQDEWDRELVCPVGGLLSVFPLLVGLLNLQAALLVWFAPKVWLLKEIAGMLK